MTPSSITTKMRRKTSGTKSAIKNRNHLTRPENRKAPEGYHSVTSMDMSKMQSRLREACQTNDRGWLRKLEEECSWEQQLASGETNLALKDWYWARRCTPAFCNYKGHQETTGDAAM